MDVSDLVSTIALALLYVVAAIAWIVPRTWVGDLCANARHHVGTGSAFIAAVMALRTNKGPALLALLLASVQLAPNFVLARANRDAIPAGAPWTVASWNVQFGNQNLAGFDGWLRQESPDVVAVLEVSPTFRKVLEHERATHPHLLLVPVAPRALPGKSWELGVLSKFPIRAHRTIDFDDQRRALTIPWLDVTLDVRGREMHLVIVHAMVPSRPDLHELRDESIRTFARAIDTRVPTMLVGDLNASGDSSAFADLLAATGLRDSRRGFGRCASWRLFTNMEFEWPTFDLDHMLVSDAFAVLDRRVGPAIGSDHRPAIAVVAWRN